MKPSFALIRQALLPLCLVLALSRFAEAETYTIRTLGAMENFSAGSVALRVTDRGEILGFAENELGERHLFLWLPKAAYGLNAGMNDLGPIGPLHEPADARAVNVHAEWVGQGIRGMPWRQAFVWHPDRGMAALAASPYDEEGERNLSGSSGADDISAQSVVVGFTTALNEEGGLIRGGDGLPLVTGFSWSADTGLQRLAPLHGFARARAMGVNDHGTIVGLSTDVYWTSVIRLWFADLSAESTGVIWRGGRPFDLNALVPDSGGLTVRAACDVNNFGQVVGSATDSDGNVRAVVLSPAGADFNANGSADTHDVVAFLRAYADSHPTADCTRDGLVDKSDVVAFLRSPGPEQPFGASIEWSESGRELQMLLTIYDAHEVVDRMRREEPFGARHQIQPLDLAQWQACGPECWNSFHPDFNPNCYGCDGDETMNPHAPDGAPGWPGNATNPKSPYAPDGGPGGDGAEPGGDGGDGGDAVDDGNGGDGGNGAPGDASTPPGEGGDGGDGGDEGGVGGDGGDGGDAAGDLNGGNGGNGGDGIIGGDGGNGGGGSGYGTGGDGGNGGDGRDGGIGDNDGGDGGQGGDGGPGGFNGNGGNGGSGGGGGDGGTSGGEGGNGGNGGDGGDAGLTVDSPHPDGGSGGDGGNGGDGGPTDDGGEGGSGGNGGDSTQGDGGGGGDGGDGGDAGLDGGDPGDGGSGGSGGNGYPYPGPPGDNGNPGSS